MFCDHKFHDPDNRSLAAQKKLLESERRKTDRQTEQGGNSTVWFIVPDTKVDLLDQGTKKNDKGM